MECLNELPRNIEFARQGAMDNLIEKQVQARMYFCRCPFRRALNVRWRAYWSAQAKWPGLSVIR